MIEPIAVAKVQQQFPSLTSDGNRGQMFATRAGQLFTAGWKAELAMAGYVYNVTVGSIAAGGDVSRVTGGGDGTVIDSDQPEMVIGTPTGYFHIPLSFHCGLVGDGDADDADEKNIILFADQTKTAPASATGTKATITPLLDGGRAAASSGYHTVTVDITDPVATQVLGFATNQAAQVDASGTVVSTVRLDYVPKQPVLLKGPCSVVACWGGTGAATAICTYCFAEVPVSRYE